ncbi:hypothetical protein N656DRAFT_88137 [Canariomyces notabilis]|uniref:Uncharacterized protein n=1 Tax=Canariomyces notabilis TaxID=2074819 RepID=A0AAN6TDH1_9PEZI|nr:hypothetical protein N656DRAFT_88137 [Canariomyces arenarius]
MSPDNETEYTTKPVVETLKTEVKVRKRNHQTAEASKSETRGESTAAGAVGYDEPPKKNEDNLFLPESEFRNVPGHVRRRTDQMPSAEPPPANPQTASHSQSTYQRLSKRARRHRQTLGDGSGSDSDSDNNGRRTRGDGSGTVARVQRPLNRILRHLWSSVDDSERLMSKTGSGRSDC